MTSKPSLPLDATARARMKQWLDNWKVAGPILEAERWQRVCALTDDEAWAEANDLLLAWERGMTGDGGEGLRLHQEIFRHQHEE